jgi:hypothetical protein
MAELLNRKEVADAVVRPVEPIGGWIATNEAAWQWASLN